MSLVAFAVRLATVQALKDETFAEDRVSDSAVEPIDQKVLEGRKALIVVYTDDDARDVIGKDVLDGTRQLDLVIEMAIASKVTVEIEGEPTTTVGLEPTDQGNEATLNFMERQVMRALFANNGTWPTLWRQFAVSAKRVVSRRAASADKGVRWAARQIVFTLDTISDPPFEGAPASGSVWKALIDAMKADATLADLAKVFEQEISADGLVDWRSAAATLGVNYEAIRDIGVGPAFGKEPEADANPPYPAPDEGNVTKEIAADEEGDETFAVNDQIVKEALPPDQS